MAPLVIPPLFYLETSAVRHLLDVDAFASLRRRIETLEGAGRLLLCTSRSTVEELATTIPVRASLIAATRWLRGVTEGRLILMQNRDAVSRWIQHPTEPHVDRHRCFAQWDPRFDDPSTHRSALEAWRDELRAHHKSFLDHYRGVFSSPDFPEFLNRKRQYWDEPANLFREVRNLVDGLFDSPRKFVELVQKLVPVGSLGFTEERIWECRKSPWAMLWLGHLFTGVAKQFLRNTSDEDLRNDAYDGRHIMFACASDALVTNDSRLAEAIQHLRNGDVPRVFMLRDWDEELDRCT